MRLWVSRMKSFISDDWLFNCIWVIMSKVNCHYGVQQMPMSWKTVNSEDQLQAGCMLWLESYQYSMLMNYMTFASSSALWTIWCQKCWYRKGLFNMISVVTNNLEFSVLTNSVYLSTARPLCLLGWSQLKLLANDFFIYKCNWIQHILYWTHLFLVSSLMFMLSTAPNHNYLLNWPYWIR